MAIIRISLQKNMFSLNLKFLLYVGLWHKEDWSQNQRLFYKIYEISLHIIAIGIVIITCIGTYQHKEDTINFLSNLDKVIGALHVITKTILFIVNRDRLKILIQEILCSGDKVNEETKKLMVTHVLFITLLGTALISAFTFLGLTEYRLPAEVWMPFDLKKSVFNFLLASQIVGFGFLVPIIFRNCAMQGIVCSIVQYIGEQLIDLQKRMRRLEYLPGSEQLFEEQFHKIIQKHVRLISYSRDMRMMFNEYFLVQNLAVTIELCLSAVMVILVGFTDITHLAGFIAFLWLALINAYIYCYLGNELIIQSKGIAQAAYETSWTSWPVNVQKRLLIVITMSQKAFTLSAGGMAVMSIHTFSQELYNGYSFFAVLNDAINL